MSGERRARPGTPLPALFGLLIAAGGLLCTACGTLSASPSSDEVAELKRRIVALQRRATVSEVEVERLREEIATLERELAVARQPGARPEPATPPDVTVVEDVETGPIALLEDVEESELEDPPLPEPPPGRPAAGPGQVQEGEDVQEATPPEAIALYDEGYTLFHQERYAEAEERFGSYLDLYPSTDLADNAQFWIGESHYARADYGSALRAFMATVERFPLGNKVPDALLKAGRCLESLGRSGQARQTYHEVTDRFPDSAAAATARERLAVLP